MAVVLLSGCTNNFMHSLARAANPAYARQQDRLIIMQQQFQYNAELQRRQQNFNKYGVVE